jgi:hypothetical protein
MILGIPISLIIAVAIYMISTAIVTEYLKKYINVKPLFLSWAVGLLIYAALAIIGLTQFDIVCLAIFIVVTGLLNSGYAQFAVIKKVLAVIVKK